MSPLDCGLSELKQFIKAHIKKEEIVSALAYAFVYVNNINNKEAAKTGKGKEARIISDS